MHPANPRDHRTRPDQDDDLVPVGRGSANPRHRENLVREVHHASHEVARRLGARLEDVSDLIQDFWVAYCDEPPSSLLTLEPARGLQFITNRVRWRLADLRRRQVALRRIIDAHDPQLARHQEARTLDQLIRQEEARRVLEVVEQLPGPQQEVIRLVFLEERQHAEVAERLGISENAVKQRIKRAVAQIREQLYAVERSQ